MHYDQQTVFLMRVGTGQASHDLWRTVYYVTDAQSNTSGSPVPEHQSAFGLALIEGGGGTADDEGGASVASKALLENTCQLAVTVGNEGFLCVYVCVGVCRKVEVKRRKQKEMEKK